MSFEFATATRIIFGSGTLAQIGGLAREFGRRALIVTGRDSSRAAALSANLSAAGIDSVLFAVMGEPAIDTIGEGVAFTRARGCDFVISFGGGAVIDAGKAIAAMLTNEGDLLDYLEVIGKGRPIATPSAPFIAIPTTAGTGAEVTRNAVLGSPTHWVKVSLCSAYMLPRVALVDPRLTLGLPSSVTANSGLDALTQLIEAFVCCRANPMTDALCEQGIRAAARSLERTFTTPDDLAAREDMSLAAMLSGIALANAGLGAVHGFAAPIGGMFPAPHGAVCAALLPHVWQTNLGAIRSRGTAAQIDRLARVARLLCTDMTARAEDATAWIGRVVAKLGIAPLRSFGLQEKDAGEIVTRAMNASSMKANPVALTEDELRDTLIAAL